MLTTKQLRELISKHNKLSKITIPPRATRPQLIKLIEGQGYKVFEEQGKIVGGPKRIIKPDTPSKKAAPKKEAPKKAAAKKAAPKKAAPAKKKIDPNSTGQKNLQALLKLGDLSSQIEGERQKLVSKDWYIVPITYLIGELYKKGLRDFKGTPLEGDGGRFGSGDTSDGWSVVYQLRGDTMINVRRLNIQQLFQQANIAYNKPSELTDKEMLIDDIFSDKDPKETNKYLEEIGGSETKGTFNVKGIKHLRDVNLSKDKWASKLGVTQKDINKDSPRQGRNMINQFKFNWNSVPWAKDGDKLLEKITNDANAKYVSENKEKISKMTVKQLKQQVGNISGGKKADYVKKLLTKGKPFYGDSNDSWSRLIKNGL